MLRIAGLLLGAPATVAGGVVANRALGLSLIEAFLAAAFIIGFAVAAAGWTLGRGV